MHVAAKHAKVVAVTRRLAHGWLLIVALLLGLVRDTAILADQVRLHVVCPEHGEVVHAAPVESRGSELRALAPSEHGGGCHLAALGPLPAIATPPAPEVAAAPSFPLLATNSAPRAPPVAAPLIRAPKTSPPVV